MNAVSMHCWADSLGLQHLLLLLVAVVVVVVAVLLLLALVLLLLVVVLLLQLLGCLEIRQEPPSASKRCNSAHVPALRLRAERRLYLWKAEAGTPGSSCSVGIQSRDRQIAGQCKRKFTLQKGKAGCSTHFFRDV